MLINNSDRGARHQGLVTGASHERKVMATAKKAAARKVAAKKVAPAPEPEELEEDLDLEETEAEEGDDELEELEEDEVAETAPAKARKKKAAESTVTFGASDLAKYITETTGHEVDARNIRTLIRKMARDGSNRVNREIVPGNRTRYDWSGPNDPEVKAIVKAFMAGELEAEKNEKLEALKERKAAQKAEELKAGKVTKKGRPKKAAPAPVVEEDDEDEELDLDD